MSTATKFGIVVAATLGSIVGVELTHAGIVGGIVGGFAGFGVFIAAWIAVDELNDAAREYYRNN